MNGYDLDMRRLLKIIQSRPLLFTGLFFIFALSTIVFFEANRNRGLETRPAPKLANLATYPAGVRSEPSNSVYIPPNTDGRKYPITDEKTYRITAVNRPPCKMEPGQSRNQEGLEVKINGEWKEVYRVEDRWSSTNCFPDILIAEPTMQLSPLKDYVYFRIVGNEWSEGKLINTKTKKSILPEEVSTISLFWSKDARNYAFFSHFDGMHGFGKEAVWVSKYKDPDSPIPILDLAEWANVTGDQLWRLYSFDSLKFVDNQTIQFSIFNRGKDGQNENEVARYEYNLQKEKLTEVFRK